MAKIEVISATHEEARVEVDGVPYHLVKGSMGWGVVCMSGKTDRFHRTYLIQLLPNGDPSKCSCGDCLHRKNWCKHLQALDQVFAALREANRMPTLREVYGYPGAGIMG